MLNTDGNTPACVSVYANTQVHKYTQSAAQRATKKTSTSRKETKINRFAFSNGKRDFSLSPLSYCKSWLVCNHVAHEVVYFVGMNMRVCMCESVSHTIAK